MIELNDIASQLSTATLKFVEEQLVRQIEILEGRVPTNTEVARYGSCGIYPDGKKEWKWRGTTVLIQDAPTFGKLMPTFRVAIPPQNSST